MKTAESFKNSCNSNNMEKSASLLHFTISSLWLVSFTSSISWSLWCNGQVAGHPCKKSWVRAQLMFIYFFSSLRGKLNWFYWIWRQLRALKTVAFHTTSSYICNGKECFFVSLYNFFIMTGSFSLWLQMVTCGVMDNWLDTHGRGRGYKPSSWSQIFLVALRES